MEWDVDWRRLVHYHGRPRDPDAELVAGSWEQPHEPIEDGCPGGYQRSPLVLDLMRYVRRRTDGGGRVSNPFFDRLESDIEIEAVLYLEEQQDRASNFWLAEQAEATRDRLKRKA